MLKMLMKFSADTVTTNAADPKRRVGFVSAKDLFKHPGAARAPPVDKAA